MFTAEEGLALRLVDEVTAKGDGVARAEGIAAEIARRGPVAVQMVKAMINFAEGEDQGRANRRAGRRADRHD